MRSTLLKTLAIAALISGSASARAAVITVNTTVDGVASDGLCSCLEAIGNSNSNSATSPDCAAGTGVDTIILPAGSITMAASWNITESVTITGQGSGGTTLEGSDSSRLVLISSGLHVGVTSLTFANLGGAGDGAVDVFGSGCSVTLQGIDYTSSLAPLVYSGLQDHAVVIEDSRLTGGINTGALTPRGSLTVRRTLFEGIAGHAIDRTANGSTLLENVTFANNTGAAIRGTAGTFTIDHCTFVGNGSAVNQPTFATTVNVSNSLIWGNTTSFSGISSITSLGYNTYQNTGTAATPATGDNTTNDPLINALGSNGGLFQSMSLTAGSLAIDSATGSTMNRDQRNYSRDATPDRGAYEVSGAPVDSTPPVISFQAPANNSYHATGSFPLWATVTDDVAIQGGSVSLTANSVYQSYSYDGIGLTRTGAALADGVYAILLGASDTGGNGVSAGLSFTVDTLTPTAQVFAADNSFTNVSASAWAQITDANLDPSSLVLTFNGVTGHNYSNGSITSTAAPVEGLNSVTLTAGDLAGNTLVLSWVFTLDTASPAAASAQPADGSLIATASPLVAVEISDATLAPNGLTLTVDGGAVAFAFDGVTLSHTASGLSQGLHAVTLTASDLAGNTTTFPWVFTVDSLTPTAAEFPANGSFVSVSASPWAQLSDANLNPAAITITVNGQDGHLYANGSVSATAAPIEGLNNVTLDATDLAGNVLSMSWSFTLDTMSPTASAEAPADLAHVATASPLVSVQVFDATLAPAGLTLTVDGGAVAFAFDGVTLSHTASGLSQGLHAVTLTASDLSGNTTIYPWVFTVDTLTPTASAEAPQDLTFTADNTPLIHVQLADANLDGGSLVLELDGGTVAHSFDGVTVSHSAATLGEGTHSVTLTASDLAGNTLSYAWIFDVDTLAPAAVNFPADGSYVNVTASGWAQLTELNLASLTLTVNSVAGHTYANGSVSPTTALVEGLNALTLTATDKASNGLLLPWVFTLDTILPVVTIQAPADLTWTASNDPLVWASAAEVNVDFGNLDLTLDGAPVGFASAAFANGVSLTRSSAVLAEGPHALTFTVADLAGNVGSAASVFYVDTQAPVAANGSPTGLTNVAAQTVTIEINDGAGIGVASSGLVVKLDGVPTAFSFDGATVTLTAATFTDGTHYVDVRPMDKVGNLGANYSFQFTVITDPNAPVAYNPSPVGVTSNAGPLIYAQLSDDISGVAPLSVSMTVDGAPVLALASASEVSFTPSVAYLPGVHTVTVDLKDVAGNQATQLVWQFTVTSDTIAPTVGNPSPLGVTSLNTPFVHVSLSDLGGSGVNPASVSMTVDGIAVPALANATDVSYTSTVLADGTHTVTVDVADNAGNQATQFFWTFEVASDTVAPVIYRGTPDPQFIVTAVSPVLSATFSETGSGIDLASAVFALDGVTRAAWVGATGISFTASGLFTGTHEIAIDVKDIAGNAATQLNWQFTYSSDTILPVLSPVFPSSFSRVTTSPGTSFQVRFDYVEAFPREAKVEIFRLGDANPYAVEYVNSIPGAGGTPNRITITTALGENAPEGNYYYVVTMTDTRGQQGSASGGLHILLDGTVPQISNGAPFGVTSNVNTLISADLADALAGIDPATVTLSLDGSLRSAWTNGSVVTFTAAALADGAHTVIVNAKDLAGNAADPLAWSFTVASDTVAPVISSGSPNGLTTNASPAITADFTESGSGIDTATAELRLDGVLRPGAVAGPASITFSASGLPEGVHTVTVDVKDLAGNAANQLVWQFTVASDITPPTAYFGPGALAPVTVKAGTSLDVVFGFSDDVKAVRADLALVSTLGGFTVSAKTLDISAVDLGSVPFPVMGAQLQALASYNASTYVGDVYLTVHDAAGNSSTVVLPNAVFVDMDAPTAGAELPLNGATVTDAAGDTAISLQLSDNDAVNEASVRLSLDGVLRTASANAYANGLSVSYTATGLSAGLHTVTVDYADAAGNTGAPRTWSFTVVRDDLVPVVNSVTVAGAPLTVAAGTSIAVSFAYTEANPASVSVTVSSSGGTVIGSTVISSGLSAGSVSQTVSVSLLNGAAMGLYDVIVTVYDQIGQLGSLSSSASIYVDGAAPGASALLPADLSTVVDANGSTLVSVDLTDAQSGVSGASAKLYLDGILLGSSVSAIPGGVRLQAAVSGLSAGVHQVMAEAADAVGNTMFPRTWSFTMVRDNIAPIVSAVTAPLVTVTAGTTVNVGYSYFEANPAYLSITVRSGGTVIGSKLIGSGLASGSVTGTAAVDLSSLAAQGVYDVQVVLVDTVGLSGSNSALASVVVDNTAPAASVPVPANGGTVVSPSGTAYIALDLADTGGSRVDFAGLRVTLDGDLVSYSSSVNAAGDGTVFLTATALVAGSHTITVEADDQVGNAAAPYTWSFTMVRDNIAPVVSAITLPISANPAYSAASGTVTVNWSYTEINPASVSVTVRSGGVVIGQTVISSGLASAAAPTSLSTSVSIVGNAPEGAYDVQVTMVDTAQQSGTLSSATSVVIDNTAPTATNGLPTGGSIVQTSSPTLSATLADAGGSAVNVASVVMRLDGAIVAATASATSVSFNTSNLAQGQHTVDVDLKDRSNNQASRLSWSFRVDTQVPSVSLVDPAPGAYVSGQVPLQALSADTGSGVTSTAFYYGGNASPIGTSWFNGTAWNDGTGVTPSASTVWDTTILSDGVYVLRAESTDLVANTGVSNNRLVTVDNTVPVIVVNPVFSPTQYQAQTITGSVTEQNFAQIRVNGVLAQMAGSAPNYTWSAVVPLISGPNGITVTAGDLAGNSAATVVGITFDPTATVHFLAPATPGSYRQTLGLEASAPSAARTMSWEVSDDAGATWYSVGTGASVVSTVTTVSKSLLNGWRLSWDTVADGLADGDQYQLRIVAYDEVGVQLGSATTQLFTVDNTAPQIGTLVLPAPVNVLGNDEVYTDLITVQGTITETGSGISRVVVEQYNSTGDHVSDSPAQLPVLADNKFSRNARLVDGYNRLVFTAYDQAGNSVQTQFVVWYVRPQNSGTICAAGGTVAAPDGTSVVVPANALISCYNVSIITVLRSLLASPADPYLKLVGEGHQIEPLSLVFQAQVQITLPYTDADLDPDSNGIPDYAASSLKVLFWDGSVWQNVGVDSINTTTKRVTVRSNHLGLFVLAADTAPLPTAPKVYLTKNPFRFGAPTSFVYEMPKPGKVTIKIYDITGDLVRTLVENLSQQQGRFTQVWDGLNNFDRFVGSGAYFFRFEADYDDGTKTTTTKAIGVLK